MKTEILRTTAEIEAIADEWSRLAVEAAVPALGLDGTNTAEWFLALRESQLADRETAVVALRDAGELVAILPVALQRRSLPGHNLSCATTAYAGRSGLVTRDCARTLGALLEGCDKLLPGWVRLDVVTTAGSPTDAVLSRLGPLVADLSEVPVESPWFALPGSREAYWAGCSQNTRQNVRKSMNKLKAMGPVTFSLKSLPQEVPTALEQILDVERRSWKHGAGTAITCHPTQERFYRAYFPRAARCGVLVAAFLHVDGRPAAHHFGMLHDGIFCCLKHSFDDALEKASPAYALMSFLVDELIARGARGFDFMGRPESFKLRWSHSVVTYRQRRLRVYRDSLAGRAARELDRLRSTVAASLRRGGQQPAPEAAELGRAAAGLRSADAAVLPDAGSRGAGG